MKFVTDGAWGTGLARVLNPDEIDTNFWELLSSLNNLIANPLQPVYVVSIAIEANALTFNMSDGSTFGPLYIPTPAFHWRDEWTPDTFYQQMDVTKVTGVGLYFVLLNHLSGATFDKTIQVSGNPALLEMFAFAPAPNLVYDIGFRYPGVLSLFPGSIAYIYEEPLVRKILLPVDAGPIASHQAYLDTPASSSNQIFNIFENDSIIGNITFAIGANIGIITLSADTTFLPGNRLSIGRQVADDPVAAGLSVVFAAQQIVS